MSPSFIKVLIDGQPMPDFLDTLDCTITHELNRHSTCTIQYREPPESRFPYECLGKSMSLCAVDQEGAELELFAGVVLQADAEWEMNGSAILTFQGVSKSFLLDTYNRSQTFNKVSFEEAAIRLMGDLAGEKPTITVKVPNPLWMIQFNETDWSFLHRLVDRFGGFLRVNRGCLEALAEFQENGLFLTWRSENGLTNFRTSGRLAPHSLFGVNFESITASKIEQVRKKEVPAASSLESLRDAAVRGSRNLNLQSGLWNRFLASRHDDFQKELDIESQRQAMSTCRGYGESRTPEITVGETIEIGGGIDVPGLYGVIKVVHSWRPGRGYGNEFVCTPFKMHLEPVAPKVERYYGPEIAHVSHTSPTEHGRAGRVKVAFLWADANETDFIPVCSPHAGADRGICFIPEVGDEVLVFFRGGDASKPFVLASHWNGKDLPPRQDLHGGDEYDRNDLKRIVTRSGNRLVFDDKEGQETMVMATPRHVRVSLFDGGKTLLLHSDGDIHINAGGTVHMKCAQYLREVG